MAVCYQTTKHKLLFRSIFGLMSARYTFAYEENNLKRRNHVKNSRYTSKIHLENCVLSEVEPQASFS
jgi:hypothetical protein